MAAARLAFALNLAPGSLTIKDEITNELAAEPGPGLGRVTLAWHHGDAKAEEIVAAVGT